MASGFQPTVLSRLAYASHMQWTQHCVCRL